MNRGAGAGAWRDRGLHARVLNVLGQRIVDGEYPTGDILNLDLITATPTTAAMMSCRSLPAGSIGTTGITGTARGRII